MSKLPQLIQVSPGSGTGRSNLYIAGENSNLYAVSRADGTCQEVYYLGHRGGAIAVAPMLVLGQLFVFENRGDHSLVRVLNTNDKGLELAEAQTPFRLKGNIVVPPQVDGRRLFVISDLGEIAVLDIEPSAQKEKVSRFEPVLASMQQPRMVYIVAGNNRLWMAENRFMRMDLIVTTGKLDRMWVKDDGDIFTSVPQLIGNTIVHTRILRGSAGVRVSAVNSETGDPLWATDLASPIASLTTAANRPAAVNTAAMLFALEPSKSIQTNADINAGAGKPQLQFQNPTVLSNGGSVFFNATIPNQIAIMSPTENDKLRVLLANFAGAKPTCVPTAVGDKFAVGLDNGQLVLIDPINGALAAKPYQPALQPGSKFKWVQPVYLDDSKTLVAAHDANRLVRVGVGESLRLLSEVPLEQNLVGSLVAIGNKVFGIEASPAADKLLSFDSTNLNKLGELELGGRLIAGPYAVDGQIYLQTEGRLHAIGADNRKLWSMDFPDTRMLCSPVKSGENLVVMSTAGQVWWVNPTNGTATKTVDVRQPFSGTPKVVASGILAGTDEGTVILIPHASSSTPTSE
jgi:outer membrane protein assembly factor BamB